MPDFIKIKNFGRFNEEYQTNFGKPNVIAGSNNSEKSTILKASHPHSSVRTSKQQHAIRNLEKLKNFANNASGIYVMCQKIKTDQGKSRD